MMLMTNFQNYKLTFYTWEQITPEVGCQKGTVVQLTIGQMTYNHAPHVSRCRHSQVR